MWLFSDTIQGSLCVIIAIKMWMEPAVGLPCSVLTLLAYRFCEGTHTSVQEIHTSVQNCCASGAAASVLVLWFLAR